MDPRRRLFVALDVPTMSDALALSDRLGDDVACCKIGLELFLAEGPPVVRAFVERGREVFLDLKLHDIPETVRRAAESVSKLGASWLTVHTAGGRAMLEAAVAGAGQTKILAVTVLTSLDQKDLEADGSAYATDVLCAKRAKLAIEAGCAGIVCSPKEAKLVRETIGEGPIIVTPGVRPAGAATGDQKRVETPRAAREAGADRIVVGRPIRDAADPAAAARAIVSEL